MTPLFLPFQCSKRTRPHQIRPKIEPSIIQSHFSDRDTSIYQPISFHHERDVFRFDSSPTSGAGIPGPIDTKTLIRPPTVPLPFMFSTKINFTHQTSTLQVSYYRQICFISRRDESVALNLTHSFGYKHLGTLMDTHHYNTQTPPEILY